MVICGSSRVADPDRHEEPCLAQGSHRRAVREPAAGRKPGIPGADDGGPRNRGSQSREPMPADSPRTLRDGPGRICRRRLPPNFLRPVQTPDSCLGVKGSRARLQSLPSFTQAFFAQAFFTFDFIPQTLPSLFGPVDRAGPAACVRDYAAGTRRCRLLGRAVRGVGWGRSRSSAAKCRRCDRVLDPFGQPLPGTGAPRVLGSCAAQCLAVLVAQRPSGWPAAAFRAGCHSACTSPRLLWALATLCACLSVCLTAVFAPLRADTRVRREMRQTVRRSLLRLCLRV